MWMLVNHASGRRALLNMDLVVGFIENEDGKADAVSMAGAIIPTGKTIDEVATDIEEAENDEEPEREE